MLWCRARPFTLGRRESTLIQMYKHNNTYFSSCVHALYLEAIGGDGDWVIIHPIFQGPHGLALSHKKCWDAKTFKRCSDMSSLDLLYYATREGYDLLNTRNMEIWELPERVQRSISLESLSCTECRCEFIETHT